MNAEEILKKHFEDYAANSNWIDKDFETLRNAALYKNVIRPAMEEYAAIGKREAASNAWGAAWSYLNGDYIAPNKEQYLNQFHPIK